MSAAPVCFNCREPLGGRLHRWTVDECVASQKALEAHNEYIERRAADLASRGLGRYAE